MSWAWRAFQCVWASQVADNLPESSNVIIDSFVSGNLSAAENKYMNHLIGITYWQSTFISLFWPVFF